MRVLMQWLEEFVAVPTAPEALAELLNSGGLAAASGVDRDEAGATPGNGAVLELEPTPNRPDWLSHYGVAREIAALSGASLAPLAASAPPLAENSAPAAAVPRIVIEEPAACGRYCARVLENVEIRPSPSAWQARLGRLGQRAINNVADLTNYTLWEMGHPTHAFDADRLMGGEICIRYARPGERLVTLDGIERRLDLADLVIADARRPVALAGVIGGLETAIGPGTQRVVIESAWFAPAGIRRTARRHGLRTDASYRFERGADPGAAPLAADRIAARLQAEPGAVGVTVLAGRIDAYPGRRPPARLRLRASTLRRILGADIAAEEVAGILGRLGFAVSAEDDAWEVNVPSWRADVAREIDLVEEVARIHGYDRFPPRLPAFIGAARRPPAAALEARTRAHLRAQGYSEAIALSFAAAAESRRFAPEAEPVAIANPLSEEAPILRTTALPSMLALVQFNLNRGTDDLRLFEMGKVYRRIAVPASTGAALREPEGTVREARVVALAACGRARGAGWTAERRNYDFFDLKSAVEDVLSGFDLPTLPYRSGAGVAFHPGRSASLELAGQPLARLGQLHPEVAAVWKLKAEVYLAEIDLESLYARGPRPARYHPPSRFPAGERDFSFLFSDDVPWEKVRAAIASLQLEALADVTPVEVFRGGSLPAGAHSLLLRARFQRSDRTLRDEEIQTASERIVRALEGLGGRQR